MKLNPPQLDQHLAKTLAPIYLVSSDETLLVQETIDRIRAAARKAGYSERISVTPDPGADWGKLLYTESHNLSLFSTKRIVELQLAGVKGSATSSKMLQEIATNPPADTLILISMGKLDSKTEQTVWYKTVDKIGVAIPIWPITLEQLPAWIMQRAKGMQLNIALDAAKLLAELVEGNLLAAAQELDKLALLQNEGVITSALIEKAVSDNAHFDIFGLVDCALSGNSKRSLRILQNLQAEDAEPILILWALTREIRTLAAIARQTQQGTTLASLFAKYRIWEKRQNNVRRFLQHHNTKSCWQMLSAAAQIDRQIKGMSPGDPWLAIQQLVLNMTSAKT